jgi:LysM repeat protein/plastocyanin
LNTNKQRVLIVTLLFLIVGSCAAYATIDLPVRADAQKDHMYWESVKRGALLFANNCRTCHGNQGEGFVAPALNTPEWRNQDPIVLTENRAILRQTLYCGRAGTTMPAWLDENGGALNVRQVDWLINFITAPEDGDKYLDERGRPTSEGWVKALEFAYNLNLDLVPTIGGDTLRSIASQHNIGVELLANENNVPLDQVNEIIPRGDTIRLPANTAYPNGFEYRIRADFDTIARLADTLFVGAAAIADLNGLRYEIDYREGTMTLLDDAGNPITGLLPGEALALPAGATYTVFAGDTVASIAERHSISVQQLRELNPDLLAEFGDDDEMDGNRRLELPPDPVVIAAEGQTWEALASRYDMTGEMLALQNGFNIEQDDLVPGQEVQLPDGARYVVQDGDTIQTIAQAHRTDVATLLQLNNIASPGDFSTDLILDLPRIDAYVVDGQDFTAVAEDYGNVTGASLASANGHSPDDVLRIGTQLRLPDASYGTAPADAINLGTACVRHAIPDAVYQNLFGEPEDFPPDEAPEDFTEELVIRSYDIDWTFDADGTELEPNRGVAKVRTGTTVRWENPGNIIHTVTISGETRDDWFDAGDTFEFTFDEPGRYRITCDFHPQQDGYVFVEDD